MGKGFRPEHQAPPEVFYNEEEAAKYTSNSRVMSIQASLTRRAVELLSLGPGPREGGPPRMLLDLGCGSGLSGEALTEMGFTWMGFDISPAMLDVALDKEVEGDVGLLDLGHGLPLRSGLFDGAISISALQWLCNADRTSHEPRKRLKRFFETLYACLARGARAVLQIYPESPAQAEMLVSAAMKVGFSGGLVVDYPHSTRAKKYYLVLMVGTTSYLPEARGLDGSEPMSEDEEMGAGDEDEEVEGGELMVAGRDRAHKKGRAAKTKGKKGGVAGGGVSKGSKQWVLKKKTQMRARGHEGVPRDTKYTARKRKRLAL